MLSIRLAGNRSSGLGARQQGVVEGRAAVARVEAAHEDEIVHRSHPGDLLDRLRCVGRGSAADFLGADRVRDRGGELALGQHGLLRGDGRLNGGPDCHGRGLAHGGHDRAGVRDLSGKDFQALHVHALVVLRIVARDVDADRHPLHHEAAFDGRGRRDRDLARHFHFARRNRISRRCVVDKSEHGAAVVLRREGRSAGKERGQHREECELVCNGGHRRVPLLPRMVETP